MSRSFIPRFVEARSPITRMANRLLCIDQRDRITPDRRESDNRPVKARITCITFRVTGTPGVSRDGPRSETKGRQRCLINLPPPNRQTLYTPLTVTPVMLPQVNGDTQNVGTRIRLLHNLIDTRSQFASVLTIKELTFRDGSSSNRDVNSATCPIRGFTDSRIKYTLRLVKLTIISFNSADGTIHGVRTRVNNRIVSTGLASTGGSNSPRGLSSRGLSRPYSLLIAAGNLFLRSIIMGGDTSQLVNKDSLVISLSTTTTRGRMLPTSRNGRDTIVILILQSTKGAKSKQVVSTSALRERSKIPMLPVKKMRAIIIIRAKRRHSTPRINRVVRRGLPNILEA